MQNNCLVSLHGAVIHPTSIHGNYCRGKSRQTNWQGYSASYYSCIDCGTVINPKLARVQVEGGVVQAIGMALYEDVRYSNNGRLRLITL
ncbi:MAG: molybdopterin cofactor-binding domain-containing protein [Veillonella sp.]